MTTQLLGLSSYISELRYLSYDNTSDLLSIPLQIRERHLTKDTHDVLVQAAGISINIMIWSDRDDIIIQLPLTEFTGSPVVERRISEKGLIAIGQFEKVLKNDGDMIPCLIAKHSFPKPEL